MTETELPAAAVAALDRAIATPKTNALAKALHAGCAMPTTQHSWDAHFDRARRLLVDLGEFGYELTGIRRRGR